MQNKYETLRMAVRTVTNRSSARLIIPQILLRGKSRACIIHCMAHHELEMWLMAPNNALNSPLQGAFPRESRYH